MSQTTQFDSSYTDGINLIELKKLPPHERHLINWIRQRDECSLLDIALHLCVDEETAMQTLAPLVRNGFLVEFFNEDGSYYRVRFAPKRSSKIFQHIQHLSEK